MSFIYENIINTFNICNTLILEEKVYVVYIKKIELTTLGIIKKENANFEDKIVEKKLVHI